MSSLAERLRLLLSKKARRARRQQLENALPPDAARIFTGQQVLHGVFEGMKYPFLQSVGSMLYPKLLGSYEREIHPQIERFCQNDYSEIIDVGCAEGYYAVGLALKLPNAKVYAYDTEEVARQLCTDMARINGVADRVEVRGFLTAQELGAFPVTRRGLVICDCEGFELELFNEQNLQHLRHCDLLVETHDFMNIEISTKLLALFSRTHNVSTIKSIDDIEKAKTYDFPETRGLDLATKKKVFRELRPAIMEWLVCTPK
ncbi:MAG: hypothetical protein EOO11_19375 [Chitinophagaceae bacterium]|nr:MAG: hypothetical protein EOO11_19375 [Chitinophagaceae bacterium]